MSHFTNYQTRNLPAEGSAYGDDRFGLDEVGRKTIYGIHRGIRYEARLTQAGDDETVTRFDMAYPGQFVELATWKGFDVSGLTDTEKGYIADKYHDEDSAADDNEICVARGAAQWGGLGVGVLVEDDIRGAPVDEPYKVGTRVQYEIFPRGAVIWAAVLPAGSGGNDYGIGQMLSIDSNGILVASTATSVATVQSNFPVAVLLQKVEKAAGANPTDAETGLARVRIL